MSTPKVPQRPTRSQDPAPAPSTDSSSTPQVPPRPSRNVEKSKSPNREFAARSPLNGSSLSLPARFGAPSNPPSSFEKRPSISALPIIGAEGEEYASLDQVPRIKTQAPEPGTPHDTRSVAGDLPLHAPTVASSPGRRSNVPPVVRTDSAKAAEVGLGKASLAQEHDDALEPTLRPTSSRPHEHRPISSSGLSREITRELSRSVSREGAREEEEDEHGIPHIGQHVPMYPNAGDVQAPSPSPYHLQNSTGIGFFNDSSKPGKDGRRKSAAGLFHGPSGSYGLHGHGMVGRDKFEQAWYQRHPDELKKEEQGAYGPAAALSRAEWALSSEQLNKLVRGGAEGGFGTSDKVIGVPTEAVGHQLTQEYTSRNASPALSPTISRHDAQQGSTESPLRQASASGGHEIDNDPIHLDPLNRKNDRYTGQGADQNNTEDLGPQGGNTSDRGGLFLERGSGTPILASDEVSRRPGYEYMQPAVSPEAAKHANDEYFSDSDSHLPAWQRRPATGSGRSSRRPSRPTSAHFFHHEPHSTGTPLNEIEEYEPLFKDEDEEEKKRPMTAADKLKRPELDRRRFPSQDIWEDTPNSLQLQTTVGGPQEEEEVSATAARKRGNLFETPDQEAKRQGEITEPERLSFLQDANNLQKAKPKFNTGVQSEVSERPGMRHRFPSRDIWEDTPDSARLEYTISAEEEAQLKSPTGGSAPANNNLARGFEAADSSMASAEAKPVIANQRFRTQASYQPVSEQQSGSAPPAQDKPLETAPISPTKSKPQVPVRPTRTTQTETAEGAALNKVTSTGSNASAGDVTSPTGAATSTRSKPTAPPKPGGSSKFASIKAGFMNDLNSRLQLGPKAPKAAQPEEQSREVEEEKAPLADARKGRARGPARRQPQGAAASAVPKSRGSSSWGFSMPKTHWSIGHSGLKVFPPSIRDMKGTAAHLGVPIETEESTKDKTVDAVNPLEEQLSQDKDLSQLADIKEHKVINPMGAEADMPEPMSENSTNPLSIADDGMQTAETKIVTSHDSQTTSETTVYEDGGK